MAESTGIEAFGVAGEFTAVWAQLDWRQREGYLQSLRSFLNTASSAQRDGTERARLREVYLDVMYLLDLCSAA